MRIVIPDRLWIGTAGDLKNERVLADVEGLAIVDLAIEEPAYRGSRDRMYFRIPLIDGSENLPERLRMSVRLVVVLLEAEIPVCVACSAGMSRSPAIVAFARSIVEQRDPRECLLELRGSASVDVMPGLWSDLQSVWSTGISDASS